jgi:linoleoyl-CoA desaturase
MKLLKFVAKDENQKAFAIAVRSRVNNYFKEKGISPKGGNRMLLKSIAMLSMYILPFIAIMLFPMSAWFALPLAVLIGIGKAGIGMSVMHDALHGSFSKKKWLNKIMGNTMYLLGSNVFTWKMQHNVFHHAYTNLEGHDEDIAIRGPIRLSEHGPYKNINRLQYIHAFFFYGLLTLSKMVKDFIQLAAYNKAGITRQHKVNPTLEYVKMIIYKLIYLFVLIGFPIIFTSFSWWQVLTGFMVIHWTAGFILSTIFQMAHVVEGAEQPLANENGVVENEWVVHQLNTTANFARNNLFLNWYVGGLNFQIEHHLFPNISHIHYRKISHIVEQTAIEYGFTYNIKSTFIKALGSHVRRLKTLGERPVPAMVAAQ